MVCKYLLQHISWDHKEKRKLIDVHNNAEQLVYRTEKQISDLGDNFKVTTVSLPTF